MRQGGERCGQSEAASSRGRNEAARGAANLRRGAPSAARRAGRCRQSRGRERGTRPFPAATPLPLTPPSPSPAAAPMRARRQGKKPNPPRRKSGAALPARPWRGAAALLGRRARASGGGARGAAKGDKMPLLSRIRAKILRKILQFSPPCAILNIPRNSISKAVRYKRAFLYLFFLIALLIC